MGFEQTTSSKSEARNAVENALRLERCSSAGLRDAFAAECLAGRTAEAAPLLGDVVLLTELTRDLRTTGRPEVEVRRELGRELEARVGKACEMAEVLEHLFHLF